MPDPETAAIEVVEHALWGGEGDPYSDRGIRILAALRGIGWRSLAEVERLEGEVTELNLDLDAAIKEKDDAWAALRDAQHENRGLVEVIDDWKELYATAEAEVERLEGENARLYAWAEFAQEFARYRCGDTATTGAWERFQAGESPYE